MAKINIADLRADVLDRMDNSVVAQRLPESARQKLLAPTRVTTAMNHAVVEFCQQADQSAIGELISIVQLSPDTDVGDGGDSSKVTTYLWPPNAFDERQLGGLLNLILNGNEYILNEGTIIARESVRYQANSGFHGSNREVFNVDPNMKRIYVPKAVTAQARVIEYPEKVDNDDTYGSNNESTLPIPYAFFTSLSQMSVTQLLGSIGAGSGAQPEAAASQQQQESESEEDQ